MFANILIIPPYSIGMQLSAGYGILDPYQGRALFAHLEQTMVKVAHSFYSARCFQPIEHNFFEERANYTHITATPDVCC